MKTIIVLFSTILLGIAIASVVINLQEDAKAIGDATHNRIVNISGSGIE